MNIKLVGINARYTHSCLALFYVRNELEHNCSNVCVDIQQFTISSPYYDLLLNISRGRPDYFFFSATIWNSALVIRLINDLCCIFPDHYCVVGGPQAEIVGNSVDSKQCVVVRGEIEKIDKSFYLDLMNNSLRPEYSFNSDRKDFSTPYRQDDFNSHLRNRHIYFETSRGCPFGCTYCLSSAQKGVIYKDLEKVKTELGEILRHNPRVLRFVDRTFNAKSERTLDIWEFLASYPCDTLFHFEISPDLFSEPMFGFLEQLPVGKFQFEIGIQSTNLQTLSAVNRHVDVQAAHQVIKRLSSMANIHLHVDLILGLPHENRKSFLKSFKDVFAMNPHYIQMGLLKVLPDTPICHSAGAFGYIYSSSPPYSVFANNWMDYGTMQDLYWLSECVERFINNRYFVSLWKHFRKTSTDIVEFFLMLLENCQNNHFFEQAPTQEFLCSMILDCIKGRSDEDHITELLRYDWLRCGHRLLPERLQVNELQRSVVVKRDLLKSWDFQGSSNYSSDEISAFLKKGYFLEFSIEVLKEVGFEVEKGQHFLCFLPERDSTLFNFSRVVLFPLP